MIVAVASGKGGTGKTSVALSLAMAAGRRVRLLDCDVEEPDCHLFLRATEIGREQVDVSVPEVIAERCTSCGLCAEACQFGGIITLPDGPHVFDSLCHGCGACVRLCPERALREGTRRIGEVVRSRVGAIELITGRLDVGRALAVPVVRAVRRRGGSLGTIIVDAPPGTSCPVVAAIRGADVAVLVTEPTPFGLCDLELAVAVVRRLKIPFGVVVNRAGLGDSRVHDYCAREDIPVLLEIPHDRRIAVAYAEGVPLVQAVPEFQPGFSRLLERLGKLARVYEEQSCANL